MIKITHNNCSSYKIYCGENSETHSGTGFVVAKNRILTARHVVKNAIKGKAPIRVNIPDQGEVSLKICVLDGKPAYTGSLVLLEPDNSQQLPEPPPLYRPESAPKSRTVMIAYGYLGKKTKSNSYSLIEYDEHRQDESPENGEIRNAQFKIRQSPDKAGGLSGSPIFCGDRLIGVLNTEDYVNRKADFVYGFCGDGFFKELAAWGIPLPASPTPPELPTADFELPVRYQETITEQLKEAMKTQSERRTDGRQPPIFLCGPAGIGKMEFFWKFAEQYSEGYVYHLDFTDNFKATLDMAKSEIIDRRAADMNAKLSPLHKCSETDILIITGANFDEGYLSSTLAHNDAYKELCKLPLHLVIATQQPIPEILDNHETLVLELKPSEEEIVEWSTCIHSTLEPDAVRMMLVKQVDRNPLLVHKIMNILATYDGLDPLKMVKALQKPVGGEADVYLNKGGPYNLLDLLKAKTPPPKKNNKDKDKIDRSVYRSILLLVLDNLDSAQAAQEAADVSDDTPQYLTAEEFEAWVHSINIKDKKDSEDKKNVPAAFEKLCRIGMIERSSMGCYSIPIIPRLLLRKGTHEINKDIDRDYKSFLQKASNARLRFEPADPETEAERLLKALVLECEDPYDSFSLFCAFNKQALETYLPELFTFGNYINQALEKCYYGDDPMEKLNEAEATLEQLCQDAQNQRTILVAKLYDTFHSALYILNHSENTDRDACCDALVRLFDAVLELHPKFLPCYTMKSQAYWYFLKEDEAYCMAAKACECAELLHGHYCADAFMIQGQYLENRADKLKDSDAAESSNYYEQAYEKYQQAHQIRSGIKRQNLQRRRQNLSRLIQCYGFWYLKEPQRQKCNSQPDWVWIYGMELLECDRKIFQDCTIDADFVEDSKTLLAVCSVAEKRSDADADYSKAKAFSKRKQYILDYIKKCCPTETAQESIFTWLADFEKWLDNPDTPTAYNN